MGRNNIVDPYNQNGQQMTSSSGVPQIPSPAQTYNAGYQQQPGSPAAQPLANAPVSGGHTAQPAPNDPKGKKGGKKETVPQGKNPNSTQNTLMITEIRDGMVVVSDGTMRAVVACKSINFDLMSAREREGIEYSYQSFLNSLYFSAQILIRSQKVDLKPYLEKLNRMRRDQDNMLLSMLMEDYIEFIDSLSEETNIMDKQFYIVIPYYPAGDTNSDVNTSKNLFASMFGSKQKTLIRIENQTYQKAKDEMQNRVLTVINGLAQMGIQSTRLDTKQLGELYYNFYNPDTAVREPIGNFDPTPTISIRKGTGDAPQPHLERELY